jgi:hypothetical protein
MLRRVNSLGLWHWIQTTWHAIGQAIAGAWNAFTDVIGAAWQALSRWMDKLQPGAWSEWVGAILTGGSLILAFSILIRDRRKDVRAQAMRVLTWISDEGDDGCAMHVKNTSDLPIFGPTLLTRPRFWWERSFWHRVLQRKKLEYRLIQYRPFSEQTLEAGDEWICPWPFPRWVTGFHRTTLRFKDAAGVMHHRDVSAGRDPKFYGRWHHYKEGTIMATRTMRVIASFHELGKPLPDLDLGYDFLLGKDGYIEGRPPQKVKRISQEVREPKLSVRQSPRIVRPRSRREDRQTRK